MQLLCDERERMGPIPFLPKDTDFIKIQTLQIGDFAITNSENIFCIFERKTWKDLSASIKDNRYEEQIKKMQLLDQDCQKYFIIEGNLRFNPDHEISGIPFFKLQAAVRKLLMLGFYVMQTKNEQDTAEQIVAFAKQYENTFPEKFQKSGTVSGNMEKLFVKRKLTTQEILDKIWLQIPGIGPNALPAVKTIGLRDFIIGCGSSESKINLQKKLNELKFLSGRKFGDKMIQKLTNITNPEKILSAFPGISDKSAVYILKQINLFKLLSLNKSDLSEIKKSDKSKIGYAAASNIVDLLNCI